MQLSARLRARRPASALLLLAGLAGTFVAASSETASAAIRCRGPFQVIKGIGEHASNYCEDGYLAQIARNTYGMNVSATAMRNNPGLKHRTCLAIGHDARLIGICSNHRPDGGRRGFAF